MAGSNKSPNPNNPGNSGYAGRQRRILILLPVIIVVGIGVTVWSAITYGGIRGLFLGLTTDFALIIVWAALFLSTRKLAAAEREARERAERQARAQTADARRTPHLAQQNLNPFEQKTSILQMHMADHARSLIDANAIKDGRVSTIYVHASVQNGASKWDCFFRAGDGLVGAGDLLRNEPDESRRAFFDYGRSLMDDYRAVCAQYHVDEPTELRITASAGTHAMHTDVSYQPLDGEHDDPYTAWASEVYASIRNEQAGRG